MERGLFDIRYRSYCGLDASGSQNLHPLSRQMPNYCGDNSSACLVQVLGRTFGSRVRDGSGG